MAADMGPSHGQQQSNTASSIKLTTRTDRSTLMFLLHTLIRPFGPKLTSSSKTYPAGSPKLTPSKHARRRCKIHERVVEDIYLYDVVPSHKAPTDEKTNDKKKKRKRIYYYSGGGWQMPASSEHWYFVTELATRLPGSAVTLVSYPLAPNSPAQTTIPHLVSLHKTLLAEAAVTKTGEEKEKEEEETLLIGDSAGGNIALSILINSLLEDENCPLPRAVLAISPSTDLRRCNPHMTTLAPHDPILRIPFVKQTAAAWCGVLPADSLLVSPLLVDERILQLIAARGVQIHGVTGGYDILSPDAELFREKCERAGVKGEWLAWEKQMHVWPLAFRYGLRESREAKEWILDVLRRS